MRATCPILFLIVATAVLPGCVDPPADNAPSAGGKSDGAGCTPGAPGEVDTCFGFVLVPDLTEGLGIGSTVQTDGKILLFGNAQDQASATPYQTVPFVRRMLADGDPDPAFTAELPSTGSPFHPAALAERPDGRMIVAGSAGTAGAMQLSVQHLLPNGARDPAMHSASFWPPSSLLGYTTAAYTNKVMLDQDGSYYIAGTIECITAFLCDRRAMFVAHFDATGMLDTTFGKDGYALIEHGPHTRTVDAVRVGDTTFVLGVESEKTYHGFDESSFNVVVAAKVEANGTLSPSFGTNGVFTWYDGASSLGSIPQSLHVQPNGSLSIAIMFDESQILTVSSTGTTPMAHAYVHNGNVMFSQFARDGSLFAEVRNYPIEAFARFNDDGTKDAAFTTADLAAAGMPAGSVTLSGNAAVEESDAWLMVTDLYSASAHPSSRFVMFRLWK